MSDRRSLAQAVTLLAVVAGFVALGQQQDRPANKPPPVKHDLEGRSACLLCHNVGAMEEVPDVPQNHAGRPNETCLMCHAPDAAIQTTDPSLVPHELEGRSACMMCHAAGAMEPVPDVPADHEGRKDEYCMLCHEPSPPDTAGGTPESADRR